jgi:protein-disulfide isomerase
MHKIMNSQIQLRSSRRRTGLLKSRLLVTAVALLLAAAASQSHAQFTSQSYGTKVLDASPLKPPAGARVAIFEFSDPQCPDCARANPVLKEAAAKYKIPWIRHDYPLPYHTWNREAAINARWFDIKSKALGEEYRDQVFANQTSFYYNTELFRKFTRKFAQSHGITMPFSVDPDGKLAAAVQADYALGQRIGINHTPTIWIVTSGSKGAPYIEVTDRSKLFQIIDQALADTAGAAKPTSKTVKPKTGNKKK